MSAKRRRRPSAAPTAADAAIDPGVWPPTPERGQHGGVEQLERPIADDDGRPVRPYRAIDILAAMERRGAITAEMRQAGDDFRARFRHAQLDPLHAGNLVRTSGGGTEPSLPLRAEYARRWVWQRVRQVGGIASPAGSCLWHVVGWEQTLKAWAAERGRDVATARGILIAALGMLAAGDTASNARLDHARRVSV